MIDKLIIEYVKEYKNDVFSLLFIVSMYEKGWDKNVRTTHGNKINTNLLDSK